MTVVSKFFWQNDKIGILSNQLEAHEHSHWLLQLFMSLDGPLKMNVAGTEIECACIVINHNVVHTFNSNEKPYFSLVVGVTSKYEKTLRAQMNEADYLICDKPGIEVIQAECQKLLVETSGKQYLAFIDQLNAYLQIAPQPQQYDKRIMELIKYLEMCDCSDHAIATFAQKVHLSTSRLAHLFKAEVGIPLKSYINLHQMHKACELLINHTTVTEAALSAGFDTPSHFASTMKRMTGMTATNLMKNSEILKV